MSVPETSQAERPLTPTPSQPWPDLRPDSGPIAADRSHGSAWPDRLESLKSAAIAAVAVMATTEAIAGVNGQLAQSVWVQAELKVLAQSLAQSLSPILAHLPGPVPTVLPLEPGDWLAVVPVGFAGVADGWRLILGAACGSLFGLTYRYVVGNSLNFHLRSGVVAAFGLVRVLSLAEAVINLAPTAWPGLFLAGFDAVLAFGVAGLALEVAIGRSWLKLPQA